MGSPNDFPAASAALRSCRCFSSSRIFSSFACNSQAVFTPLLRHKPCNYTLLHFTSWVWLQMYNQTVKRRYTSCKSYSRIPTKQTEIGMCLDHQKRKSCSLYAEASSRFKAFLQRSEARGQSSYLVKEAVLEEAHVRAQAAVRWRQLCPQLGSQLVHVHRKQRERVQPAGRS